MRKVPTGQSGLFEIAENYMDSDEPVSASNDNFVSIDLGSRGFEYQSRPICDPPSSDSIENEQSASRVVTSAIVHNSPNSDTMSIDSEETFSVVSETLKNNF